MFCSLKTSWSNGLRNFHKAKGCIIEIENIIDKFKQRIIGKNSICFLIIAM